MNQNPLYANVHQNEGHEPFFSETVDNEFNDYASGLQQPADVIPPDNVNSPCDYIDCINCSTIVDSNLKMTYEDTNDHSESPQQISLAPCPTHINHNVNEQVSSTIPQNSSMPQDICTTQYSPMHINEQCSSTQQYICNNANSQHRQPSISTFSSTRDNNSSNSTNELFKIVISGGFEISVRHPYLSQNY